MINLTRKQTKAFNAATSGGYQAVIFGGAIRGGKSYALIITFFYLSLMYEKSRWIIIRRSLPDLKRNTFPTVNSILDMGVREKINGWNHDTQTITMLNGSQIMFMAEGYDDDKDLNRFKGLEANGFGFDEINECQEATFYKAIERSGTWLHAKGKAPMLIFATLNPAQNWTKKLFYEPYVSGELNSRWLFISSKITDNPHIPEEYRENLKSLSPIEYARFVEGDWDAVESAENPFLWAWDDQKHISQEAKFNPNIPTYFSVDFNVSPLCALVIQHQGATVHVVDEILIEKGSVDALCDYIEGYGVPIGMIRITGDAMGNGRTYQQRDNSSAYMSMKKRLKMNDKQFMIIANPTHKNSREDCNAALIRLNIKVNPKCKGFIFDAKQVNCDAEGHIIKSNRKLANQRADLLDDFRYFVNAILKRYL
jgi:hypothetical protein